MIMQFWKTIVEYDKHQIVQYGSRLYQSLLDVNKAKIPGALGSETYWASYADPISQVYDALWSMVEASPALADMIKTGNRIKYSGENRDPQKPEISDADMPELQIISVGTSPGLSRTSSGSSILKRFRVQVSTGDQRLDSGLYAIEWELYRAFVDWATTLKSLTWNSKAYVIKALPVSVQDGKSNNELQRGIRGWISLWECEVEMWFSTADMSLAIED
jgi:hypothetical protein